MTDKKETGLPIVTELLSVNDLDLFKDVDVIQIGARNMQNFELLKEVGKLEFFRVKTSGITILLLSL